MKPSSIQLILCASILAVTQGCKCNDGGSRRGVGEVRIIYTDATGAQLSGENGLYDFGTVSMGKDIVQKLTVQNVGLGTLVIQKFTKESGTAAKVGSFV